MSVGGKLTTRDDTMALLELSISGKGGHKISSHLFFFSVQLKPIITFKA